MFSLVRDSKAVWPIVLLLSVLIAGLPVGQSLAQAQGGYNPGSGCMDGESAGERAVSGGSWFIIGCLGGIWGLLAANLMAPTTPSSQLLGKDPAYVAAFTDCYQKKVKSLRTKNAMSGCITSIVLYGVVVLVIVITAEETTDYYYDPYYY